MDFSKFDTRPAAERGAWLHVVHPTTGEPLYSDEGKPCRVLVRGPSSPTIQAIMRRKQLEAFERERRMTKEDIEKSRAGQVMEDIHRRLVEGAAPFIMAFENIDRSEGVPARVPDDVEWWLGLVFPVMRAVDEDGRMRFEMANKPFTQQVADFAADSAVWLGNG